MYEIYCKLKEEKGVKDADVARETDITKSTFTDWKNGRSVPGNEKMKKIAEYFGVTVDYILTGEKPDMPIFEPEHLELIELYSKLKEGQKLAVMNLLRSFAL